MDHLKEPCLTSRKQIWDNAGPYDKSFLHSPRCHIYLETGPYPKGQLFSRSLEELGALGLGSIPQVKFHTRLPLLSWLAQPCNTSESWNKSLLPTSAFINLLVSTPHMGTAVGCLSSASLHAGFKAPSLWNGC